MLGHSFAVFCVIFIFQSSNLGRESWLLHFCCVLNVMHSYRSLNPSRGDIGWSVVCDCAICLVILTYFFYRDVIVSGSVKYVKRFPKL